MGFKDMPADNFRAIKEWHDKKHHSPTWATCPHEPCAVTTPKFRSSWDAK